jgi:hypothetical protein
MNEAVFFSLFKEACEKCFGIPFLIALTETDSKILSNAIFEHTGLVIGAKSIKNYSMYVLSKKDIRKENPSDATLDTLARYVLAAPRTDELQRKKNESHFPYWYQYRNQYYANTPTSGKVHFQGKRLLAAAICLALVFAGILGIYRFSRHSRDKNFTDNFNSVAEDSLLHNGWIIKSPDSIWWNKRNEKPGHLALFTLKGDNWNNAENPAHIHNLMMRKISSDCFTVEIHLTRFIPAHNWQQAGILLCEDSVFSGKMLRLSISYNDFFGGYQKPPEIIIQAVSSAESGSLSKPEEIAHQVLFSVEPGMESLVDNNLSRSALKIEKNGSHFRLLYSAGPIESFAFKEILSRDISLHPAYIGLFALQGWADHEDIMPAYFDSFTYATVSCRP